MEFLWQRAQCFGQQLELLHVDVQIAFTGFVQGTLHTDDVTDIQTLVFVFQLLLHFFRCISLNAARGFLNHQEWATFCHHTTSDRHHVIERFQFFLTLFTELLLQITR
ncbi:Uncharacterised protein [Vibrio cholerae]|nr:Uncharacterised protein [Vibrio cholerae]CSC59296.1 Uncharacterised protein [Vibrio cholerae]